MKLITTLGLVTLLTACAGANITSQVVRDSPKNVAEANMKLRCLDLNSGGDQKKNAQLEKYDGWKMVYVSENVAKGDTTTVAVVCFEKLNK